MNTFWDADRTTSPKTAQEWTDRMNAPVNPRPGTTSRALGDGRVLDTKGAVLEFLAELEAARHDGRSLEPIDDGS